MHSFSLVLKMQNIRQLSVYRIVSSCMQWCLLCFLWQLYVMVYVLTNHCISESSHISIDLRTLTNFGLDSLHNHISLFVCKFKCKSNEYTRTHLRNIAYCYCTFTAVCKYLLMMVINCNVDVWHYNAAIFCLWIPFSLSLSFTFSHTFSSNEFLLNMTHHRNVSLQASAISPFPVTFLRECCSDWSVCLFMCSDGIFIWFLHPSDVDESKLLHLDTQAGPVTIVIAGFSV